MINEFIAQVKSTGIARTNRYEVIIPYGLANEQRLVTLYCESVAIPGVNYGTTPQKIFGEHREFPTERMYDPISLTFYVDSQLNIKAFFDAWMQDIMHPIARTFNYYNDYKRDVTLKVINVDDSSPYTVTLRECYPKSVAAIQLSAESKEMMKLNVTLQYKYIEHAYAAIPQGQSSSAPTSDPAGVTTGTSSNIPGFPQMPKMPSIPKIPTPSVSLPNIPDINVPTDINSIFDFG